MPLIEYTIDGKIDRVKQAVQRIRNFDPLEMGLMDEPYYVAYSGGKDSDAIRILCDLAGVKHDLVNNHTTVDAPETVRYIRSIPHIKINYPEQTMWQLIVDRKMPPTMRTRYCCEVLKERGGMGRIVMTGVRWAESQKRKTNRGGVEILSRRKQHNLILNADNDESRRLFETCQMKGKRVINPIIDWSDADVWEFLNHYGCVSNPLYQCGYHRVGCVGCPMSYRQKNELEVNYPKYKNLYIHAFQRMVNRWGYAEKPGSIWTSGEAVYDWWLRKNTIHQIDGQETLW